MVSMQCNPPSANRKRRVRLNDLVHAVWAAIRIFLRAIDKIIEACHAAAADLVRRRTRDDFSAVVGTVTDEDDQKTHNFQKEKRVDYDRTTLRRLID
jgi:hypothetical protein